MSDRTIAHYRIEGELGRGGMGIVYRAFDTKLDRAVAIKVLPPHALGSEDDRARFFREAKAAAQLSHAHICHVYQVDEAPILRDGAAPDPDAEARPFIAMELVDGESLADRVAAGPMKLSEAVRIASEVADALGAAHEAGVVHRDVKAGNVMLTKKGAAKVLDFGLAKTAASTQLTRQGSTLGTVAYMSPEQARGEEVDRRTDLWALGVVLYEMVAGRLPFSADYEQAALYAILNEDPEPLTAVRTGVPMALEGIVAKLLAKDPRHRYQSADDLIADLSAFKEMGESMKTSRVMSAVSRPAATSRRGGLVAWAGWAVASVAIAGLAWALLPTPQPSAAVSDAPTTRLTMMLPDELPLAFIGASDLGIELPALAISAAGDRFVYVAQSSDGPVLVARRMGENSYRVLDATEDASSPTFSPDGQWVAFISEGELRRVPFGGGPAEIVNRASDAYSIHWAEDDQIYWVDRQGIELAVKPAFGEGQREVLVALCGCNGLTSAPASDEILVSSRDRVGVVSLADRDLRRLDIAGFQPWYTPTGHLLYARSGRLVATRVDPATLTPVGATRTVVERLRTAMFFSAQATLSRNGTLIYAEGEPGDVTNMVVRQRDGSKEGLPFERGQFGPMDLSPDQTRLLIYMLDGTQELLLLDLERGTREVVHRGPTSNSFTWTPDSESVIYASLDSAGTAVLKRRLNSARDPEVLFRSEGQVQVSDVSADGRLLVHGDVLRQNRIFVRDLETGEETSYGSQPDVRVWGGQFSPDDRYLAYTLVGEQGSEVYVEPYPETGERWLVSAGYGEEPVWVPELNELVFRSGQSWYAVAYDMSDGFAYEPPRELFTGPYVNIGGMEFRSFDDGRMILLEPINLARTTDRLQVVMNWFPELEALVDEGS
jgi:serine/threonine protein kinase/Tol biopolymer transport system component